MRILGLMMVLAGLVIGGFAIALGSFLLSNHSGSAVRMRAFFNPVLKEAVQAFAWLDMACLALLVASFALIVCGFLMGLVVQHPDPVPRRR